MAKEHTQLASPKSLAERALRITIVQGPFLPVPALRGGAIERIMETLGRHWAAEGHQITHISRRFAGLPDEELKDGVHHLRIKSRDAPRGRVRFRLAELIYCFRVLGALPPGDIVVMNSVLLPFLLRSRRKGYPVVWLGRAPKGQFRFLRHVPLVQTMSKDMVERVLRQAPWMKGRVTNVGAPLAPEFAPLTPEELAIAGRDEVITYLGRLHPEKGLELLIEAFLILAPRFPAWRLQIIGPSDIAAGGGGQDYRQRLDTLAARLPGRISFTGPIYDKARLVAELRRSELFVYPSLAEAGEALGLAPVEAAGQGAIPILSDLACFRDFAMDGESALVFDHRGAGASTRLAKAMERALADNLLRRGLREKAVAAARNYEAGRVAAKHLADYRRLLAGEKLDF